MSDPDFEQWQVILVAVSALFAGGFVKGAIGFGLPLVVTPILIIFFPLPQVISLIFLSVLVSNIQQIWLTRKVFAVFGKISGLVITNAIVLVSVSGVLVSLDGNAIRLLIGVLIIVHVLVADRSVKYRIPAGKEVLLGASVGGVSGLLGSVTSIFAFPSIQFLYTLRLTSDQFVFASGCLMISGFTSIWLGISLGGFPVGSQLEGSLYAIIPTVIGMLLGNRARQRLSFQRFRVLIKFLLGMIGINLIIQGVRHFLLV
ncbi:MAG: putative membrane protein YfcA [Parasphingorhabdus sp.]|jgi:uncharacterized membrane protein YfcA